MTTQADRIAAALRPIAPGGKLAPADVGAINSLGAAWQARLDARPDLAPGEPAWTVAARKLIGLKEVPGPRHNPTIVGFWSLGGGLPIWGLKTDEDAWCGGFQAWAMKEAGIPFPKKYPRAGEWATWGVECRPQVGAIGVKARAGGNHVFQIVGITHDRHHYKALGGNQANGVNVSDIAVADVKAVRWPEGVPERNIALPVMPRGTIGGSES